MEKNELLIICLVGAILLLLVLIYNKKEGFFVMPVDPFAYDYAYSDTPLDNPFNLRWNAPKREVPVEASTHDHPYVGFTGYNRPACDFGY